MMTECENCKRLEDMYIKDTGELMAEISRLRREIEELKGSGKAKKESLPRHI